MSSPDGAGRDDELARIRALATRLRTDGGRLVVLTGPTGIGKSFLARRVLHELPPDVRAVVAAPSSSLPVPPLWPVRHLIRTLLHRDGSVPVPADLDPPTDPGVPVPPGYVQVEQAVDRLVSLSSTVPVVAVLDDVDRADPLTVAALEALSERLHTCRLLVLACARSGPAEASSLPAGLSGLRGRPRVLPLPLPGLADDVVARIVEDTHAGIDPDGRGQIVRAGAGNPLLAQELARRWTTRTRRGAGPGPAPAPPVTATARELVGERLAFVAADDVLATLAMAGRPVATALLVQVVGRPPDDVHRAVQRAAALGVVTLDAGLGHVRMSDPVFTEVLLQRLDPDTVRGTHLRLAAALDQATAFPGPHLVDRARHLIAAGEQGEPVAAACLAAGRYEEDGGRLASALELAAHGAYGSRSDPPTRVRLLRLYGRCLADGGEVTAARRELLRAVDTARRTGDPELLGPALLDLTAFDDADTGAQADERIALLDGTAAALTGPGHAPLRGRLLARLAELLHLADPARARRLAGQALVLAGDDSVARREARHAWVLAMAGVGRLAEVEAARSRWPRPGHRGHPDAPAVSLLPALIRGDRPAVEHALALAGQDATRRPGSRAGGLVRVARLGLAVADADGGTVTELADQASGSAVAEVRMPAAVLDLFWQFHSGTADPARRSPSPRPDPSGRPAPPPVAPSAELTDLVILTRAALRAVRGDREAELWIRLRLSDGRRHPPGPDPGQDLGRAVTALCGSLVADRAVCRSGLDHLAGHPDRFVTLSTALIGPVGWFAAAAHAALGELPEALAANACALESSRRFGSPTWTAQCLVQRAALLAGPDPVQARGLASQAADLARDRGLGGVGDLVAQVLRALPVPQYPLNPRQLELLRLAAKGLSNEQLARRLYVSTPTVERHLSHIYRTLGVANRAAATRWLAVHGPEFMITTEF